MLFGYACAGQDLAAAATHQPVRARQGMVASASPLASQAGMKALKGGGNAVDAAAVVAMTLAVTHPEAGNLGGGGFMLIRTADGRSSFLDFRERAPKKATRDMYLDGKGNVVPGGSTVGVKAVGVPGTVAGIALALQRLGTISFADACRPAELLARKGFRLSRYEAGFLRAYADKLERFPESRRIFLRDGNYYREGELFRQPQLAKTFGRLIQHGPREFYQGETARLLVKAMGEGGLITLEDLKGYRPVEREPLVGTYRGFSILTAPPPSSGGVALLEMLNMLEGDKLPELEHNSPRYLHLVAEVMRRAFADRAAYMGDPDFVSLPTAELTAKGYAAGLRKGIDPAKASVSSEIRPGLGSRGEPESTTHFSVVDAAGNMVSCTYTLNDNYGSGVTVPGAGFLLNNEMDDFTSKPGAPNLFGLIHGKANAIAPGKRPLSSMTPTIVLRDNKPWFAIGGPGGPRIINAVFQVLVNIVDFDMNLQQAIDMPRIHHQWFPDILYVEKAGYSEDIGKALEARGHSIGFKKISNIQGVMIEPGSGMRVGASDPRGDGRAVGY
ncbi:MAG: gamma-glutamyltransferase [Geobacteraceae bacterium GWC2_58_44]|nr:MAG: gamma-glutamyltransferase [Geobacteraceae bacterium GWC2_58_44]